MESKIKYTTRNQSQIIKQIEKLPSIKRYIWSEFEDDMIKKYYPIKGSKIASVLGKTIKQVQARAQALNVKIKKN